jgi:2-phospho-L-lactate guanylyltransferase
MRPLAACKRRLAREVPDLTREALVLMLLDRTVRAVTAALGPGACWVIGGDAPVRQVTGQAGGTWLEDRGSDLNATVLDGIERAREDGADAALFMPADLPMIAAGDIAAIVEASEGCTRPVGVEASADGGTNALLVPAGLDLAPALGLRSYSRHRENAARAGAALVAAEASGLAFDIDSPADLAHARAHIPAFAADLAAWEQRVVRDLALHKA